MTKQEALATIAAIKEANKTYYFDGTIDILDYKKEDRGLCLGLFAFWKEKTNHEDEKRHDRKS